MTVKVKYHLTCDEPGCEETESFYSEPWNPHTADAPADKWQLPPGGSPTTTPCYCPRHRKPDTD